MQLLSKLSLPSLCHFQSQNIGAATFSKKTLIIKTFSIMALWIEAYFVILSITIIF